jgi:predicted RND superfamily exporter protein
MPQNIFSQLDHLMKLLKMLHKFFLYLQKYAMRQPLVIFSTLLLIFFVLSFGATKLQFLLSIDDLIEPDFSTYNSLKQVNEEFKDKNTILLSIESDEVFSKKYLCDLQLWILKIAKEKSNDLIRIQSTFGIRQASIDRNQFKMESFLKLDCLSDDPETATIEAAFKKIRSSPWNKILTIKNGYSLTFNFIVYDPENLKFGSINTQIVKDLQKDFNRNFAPTDPIHTYWGGVTTYQSYLREAFDQTQLLNGLMFILSLFIFRYFLGSWKCGFIFNGTVFFTLILAYGIMGFCQIPVDVLTNSTGLMLIVSCLEDFIFVAYGMKKFSWSLRKSLRKFIFPSFFTSLTTAIGFGSLVTSDLGIIRRFGLISAIATMIEWLVIFVGFPAILKMFPKIGEIKFKPVKLRLRDPWQKAISPKLAYGLIFLVLLGLGFSKQLIVKDSPNEFFFKNHIINTTSAHFLKTRGWVNEASLVFNGGLTLDRKTQIIDLVRKIELIDLVENASEVKKYLSEGLLPEDQQLVNRLWENSAHSQRLISSHNLERTQLFINSMTNEDVSRLSNQVKEICQKDCELVGSLVSYNEFSVKVLNTLFSSLGMSLILVIIILATLGWHLRKRDLFACILSAAWGPLALLGLFILFKIPLFFVSCICASVLVGLAGDNAIQFIFFSSKSKLDNSIDDLTEASLIVTIGMMILTSVFIFSSLAPLAKLGGFILLGFILGYLGDVWILRGLLKK